ncbi:hypothetical protein pipiens_016480 [Culex pipiens pipiens]|uniref:ZU5 domain-containing protein n=1 Tax=Culex pipiens pipiens TaxID=38569 RepID=A0ABD1CL41_CULPP
MMEPRSSRMMDTRFQEAAYDPRQYYAQQQYYGDPRQSTSPPPPQHSMRGGYQMHEEYHPKDPNSTYQNLETESIYGNYGGAGGYYDQEQENLYANRALIELERSRPGLAPGSGSNTTGRRIVRRHSMADRSAPSPSFNNINRRRMGSERYQMEMNVNDESIYQSKSGSYMYNDSRDPNRRIMDEPVYQSRREMHRDHLYQSKKQMQDRIQQSRLEMIQNQHRDRSETMLSPLVMCGPQGTEFLQPVTLNIPHCAGRTTSLGLSLKATDSEKNLQTDWDNIELPSNAAAHTVSVKVDHF